MSVLWTFPDDEWAVLDSQSASKSDLARYRKSLEAAYWVVKHDRPWRELPADYGAWMCVYKRCKMLEKNGMLQSLRRSVRLEIEHLSIQGEKVAAERRVYRRLLKISHKCIGRGGALSRGRTPKEVGLNFYHSDIGSIS